MSNNDIFDMVGTDLVEIDRELNFSELATVGVLINNEIMGCRG